MARVLARLGQIGGVHTAETDQAADYLRLSVRDGRVVGVAREALTSLGYAAEPTNEDARVARWFGVRTVRELSLIEAGVIADRILPQLADRIAAPKFSRLREAIVVALHACFVSAELTSASSGQAFRSDCVQQTIAAASPIVGVTLAGEVGRLLDRDMGQVHKDTTAT